MLFSNQLLKGFYSVPDTGAGAGVATRDDTDTGGGELSDTDILETGDGGGAVDDGGVGSGDGGADDGSLAGRVAAKPAPPDLSQVWKQHGLTDLPNDPQELVSQFQQSRAAQQRVQQLQDQLLWQAHNQRQAQEAQQREAAKVPAKKLFDLPEFDREWLNLVTTDENGNIVAKNGVDPSLPQKINAYAKARESHIDKFLSDPMSILQGGIQPMIEQAAQRMMEQKLHQYHQQNELKGFEKENSSWVFQNGKNGSITPAAERWNVYYQEALRIGYQNPIQYAQRGLDAELTPILIQQQAEKEAAGQAATDARTADKSFLKRAAAQSNRGNSLPNAAQKKPPQNPRNVFSTLKQKLKDLPDHEKP